MDIKSLFAFLRRNIQTREERLDFVIELILFAWLLGNPFNQILRLIFYLEVFDYKLALVHALVWFLGNYLLLIPAMVLVGLFLRILTVGLQVVSIPNATKEATFLLLGSFFMIWVGRLYLQFIDDRTDWLFVLINLLPFLSAIWLWEVKRDMWQVRNQPPMGRSDVLDDIDLEETM
jgi:hypothetical protein